VASVASVKGGKKTLLCLVVLMPEDFIFKRHHYQSRVEQLQVVVSDSLNYTPVNAY